MNNPPRLWTTDHPNKIAGAREPSVAEVVVWLREQGAGEEVGWHNDDWGIPMVGYFDKLKFDDDNARFLVIPLDTEPPKEEE